VDLFGLGRTRPDEVLAYAMQGEHRCSTLFTGTKRILGRVTASQMPSASAASFLLVIAQFIDNETELLYVPTTECCGGKWCLDSTGTGAQVGMEYASSARPFAPDRCDICSRSDSLQFVKLKREG